MRAARLPMLILAVGLLLTAFGGVAVHQADQRQRQERGLQLADEVGTALEARLAATVAVLSATVGLFQASEVVSREEFHRFFHALNLSHQTLLGIQGIGYSAVVPPGAERQRFVDGVRRDGEPVFRLWPQAAAAPQPPANPHEPPLTSAIIYLQPHDWRNRRAIGFNMYGEPKRRAAMAMAALSGRPSLTAPVRLVQERDRDAQVGTLVYVPVHRRGTSDEAILGGRLDSLQGWAYAPIRMGNLLMAGLAGVENRDLPGSRVMVYDGIEPRAGQRLADTSHQVGAGEPPPGTVWIRRAVLDRQWLIGVNLPAGAGSLLGLPAPVWLTGLSGALASTAAAVTARLLVGNHLATRSALEQARQASEERALAAAVFEASPIGMIITDPDGVVVAANIAFTQISGWSQREAVGHKANLLRSGRHDDDFYRNLWESIIQRGYWNGEIWNRHRNGQIRRHELSITAVLNGRQQITHFIGMLSDITERHAEQEKVRHQALHDYLTGLPNRALLLDQLQRSLALERRRGGRVALLFMDLDGFKPVNDLHGHQVGDGLLQAVAHRLEQELRASDTLCRQGGDEFVLLVPEAGSDADLEHLASKLQEAVGRPYPELPPDIQVSMSVGIACWPEHARDADGLFQAADAAMYAAKRCSGQRLRIAAPLPAEEVRMDAAPDGARSAP